MHLKMDQQQQCTLREWLILKVSFTSNTLKDHNAVVQYSTYVFIHYLEGHVPE